MPSLSSRTRSVLAAVGLIFSGVGCVTAPRDKPVQEPPLGTPGQGTPFVCIGSGSSAPQAAATPTPLITYGYVAPGLYSPKDGTRVPSTFDFVYLVQQISRLDPQPVVLKGAWNNYTVGKFGDRPGCAQRPGLEGQSNFIDPYCELANAWFGLYTVLDDEMGLGRKFMLKDPAGPPDNPDNLRTESMMRLTELDQKLTVCISKWGMADYSWEQFQRDFLFKVDPGSIQTGLSMFGGAQWRRAAFSADTIAALPDPSRVNIPKGWFFDAVGVPTSAVLQYVDPWYPVTLHAETFGRYISCPSGRGIWAVLYFNGATLRTRQGELLDHWTPQLQKQFAQMADQLRVQCPLP